MQSQNRWLIAAGVLSLVAALLHVAVIIGGSDWYLFFGAGEELAGMAARGSIYPALITSLIAAVLCVWGLYAFSGAGLIRPLPFLKWGLLAISTIYGVRGATPFVAMVFAEEFQTLFWAWSSLICCVYALAYGLGTMKFLRTD